MGLKHDCTQLFRLIKNKNWLKIENLLRKGFNINSQINYVKKMTLLHHAAVQGKRAFIINLIDNGADINLQDMNGDTPLHLLIWYLNHENILQNNTVMIKYFIEKGANIDIKNKEELTVRQYLVNNSINISI